MRGFVSEVEQGVGVINKSMPRPASGASNHFGKHELEMTTKLTRPLLKKWKIRQRSYCIYHHTLQKANQ